MHPSDSSMSRRRFLASGAATAGLTAAASLLPPSVQAALAAPPRPGGLRAIEHVVILMQENRSFDHYYGTLRGVRGFGDRSAIELPDGSSVFAQPTGDGGHVLPFSIRDAAADGGRDIQCVGTLDHSWPGGHRAWNNGHYDQWVPAKTAATMSHYGRDDLPFHYELADTFTICDAYHCSAMTSTSPNRNYLVSGTTGFEADGRRAIGNDAYDEDHHPGYGWPTYAEHLSRAGISWKAYQEWNNYTDNNLEFFTPFKRIARAVLDAAGLPYQSLGSFYHDVRHAEPADADTLLAKLARGVTVLDGPDRELYDRALYRGRPQSLTGAFAADIAAGTLPAVSYLVTSAAESEHPDDSSPAAGAALTYRVLDALATNRDVWDRTAVFITYDENDGYFDHVPPPVPPGDTTDEYVDGQPIGLGVRVPMIVVSPWTVGGYVCSETFDHTSIVRFLEKWSGVRSTEISGWRRTVAGDLTGAFDFTAHARAPRLDTPGPVPPFTDRWAPVPPADQRMPQQEPGSRPARALPYQCDAHGCADGSGLRLALRNEGTRSSHFTVYTYGDRASQPRPLGVIGSQAVRLPLNGDGTYRAVVTGPNRFRRDFAGTGAERVDVQTMIDVKGRAVLLTLHNRHTTQAEFVLASQAYTDRPPLRVVVPPGGTTTARWQTAAAQGWYDLTVTASTDPAFRRRLVGHLENGKDSVSG